VKYGLDKNIECFNYDYFVIKGKKATHYLDISNTDLDFEIGSSPTRVQIHPPVFVTRGLR
jgi:hypothetical protein